MYNLEKMLEKVIIVTFLFITLEPLNLFFGYVIPGYKYKTTIRERYKNIIRMVVRCDN